MNAKTMWSASKRFAFVAIAGLMISASAAAQNLGTSLTDLWWNPAEPGWGVTIDHQQNFMFMTFYVYRADGSPYWVTASLQKVGTSGLGTTPIVFSGTVYESHGPYFGAAYSAAATNNPVGTITFTGNSWVTATIQYSVNGVAVTKQVERITLQTVDYSAEYDGAMQYQTFNCTSTAKNGLLVTDFGKLTIAQSGNAFNMTAQGSQSSCTFNGTYSQKGSLGLANGNYSCTDGTIGTFALGPIQWNFYGMTAGFTGQNQQCAFSGAVGGVTSHHMY